jgi:phospholipid-binding lipoprotein MlaA
LILFSLVGLLTGCCGSSPGQPDPYGGVNRAFFGFNDGVDRYALEPAAKGWTFITPEAFRVALDKAFKNLKFPVRFVSNLGQGEVVRAGSELARFITNSTLGMAGFFDPATRIGLAKYDEDFGQMFGRWGISSGPYWVIPIVGPSNPRDGVGYVFDSALNPLTLLGPIAILIRIPEMVNGRAIAAEQIDLARAAALDYYVFVRDAYIQRRLAQIRNEELSGSEPGGRLADELYEVPDDLYEVEEDPDEVEPADEP